MAEQSMPDDQLVSDGTTDPSQAATKISYCPLMDIYHYQRADGSEYLFDTEHLLVGIETYLREGKQRLAEFMGQLTSWARQFPHKQVTLYPDARFEVRNLEPHVLEEEESGEGGGGQGGQGGQGTGEEPQPGP